METTVTQPQELPEKGVVEETLKDFLKRHFGPGPRKFVVIRADNSRCPPLLTLVLRETETIFRVKFTIQIFGEPVPWEMNLLKTDGRILEVIEV